MKTFLKTDLTFDEPESKVRKHKVLVIEDDPSIREVLGELFNDAGYASKFLPETFDIVEEVLAFKPDLVLLDYMLPTINGGELCSQLKNNLDTSCIPVVIYSAFSKVLFSLGDYGCDAFVEKPFDVKYLMKVINELASKQPCAA